MGPIRIIDLSGSPRAMGRAFGAAERTAISGLYEARMSNARGQARQFGGRTLDEGWLLRVAARCLPIVEAFHPAGLAELEGIAEGSGRSLAEIWAMNALTDLRDLAAFAEFGAVGEGSVDGCSALLVHGDRSMTGAPLFAQTWDLATDNLPFVRLVRRRPNHEPRTLALTTAGCLSLIGMNESGVAVGTTNLRTSDGRLGVGYLDVLHRALAAESFDEAASVIRTAPRAAAHFYALASPEKIQGFACSASIVVERPVERGFAVQCNHALEPELAELEVPGLPVASSRHRQHRLTELAAGAGALSPETLRRFLADDEGGALAINRDDFDGITSNGSVVMDPAGRRLWAVHGPADRGTWTEHTVGPATDH